MEVREAKEEEKESKVETQAQPKEGELMEEGKEREPEEQIKSMEEDGVEDMELGELDLDEIENE